ncbi:MAG: hypothetical protein JST42_29985 [Bacteroidetes bacterium]|nr:hypothetical protein [Bacteroidota bacterium]
MFDNFNTHNDSHERAFEALCAQLFERWVYREYPGQVGYFTILKGSGGDGGVEAYAILTNGDWIGVQSKWYPYAVTSSQIGKIKESVKTALEVRPAIKRYIVCIPRNLAGAKKGKGGKIVEDTEEKRVNDLTSEVVSEHSGLRFEFWKESRIREELQYPGNEGIKRYWFEKVELSIEHLVQRFELAKSGWLRCTRRLN